MRGPSFGKLWEVCAGDEAKNDVFFYVMFKCFLRLCLKVYHGVCVFCFCLVARIQISQRIPGVIQIEHREQ